jgi:hypothetical protein
MRAVLRLRLHLFVIEVVNDRQWSTRRESGASRWVDNDGARWISGWSTMVERVVGTLEVEGRHWERPLPIIHDTCGEATDSIQRGRCCSPEAEQAKVESWTWRSPTGGYELIDV